MNFEQLVNKHGLGQFIKASPVPGGRLHEIWKIETTQGVYAVKVLNHARVSPADLNRYRQTERIASALSQQSVAVLSAIPFNHDVIYQQDNNYCLAFPWIEGNTDAIAQDPGFANALGRTLGQIHQANIPFDSAYPSSSSYVSNDIMGTKSWIFEHLTEGLSSLLTASKHIIQDIEKRSQMLKSHPLLDEKDCILSHRDMDPSNVMVTKDQFIPIDWELAGYIEPCYDVMLTALYTARKSPGQFDLEQFVEFIKGYTAVQTLPHPERWEQAWVRVLDGWLDWLHFNLTRANQLSNSVQERYIGTIEAEKILKTIKKVYELKPELEQIFNSRTLKCGF